MTQNHAVCLLQTCTALERWLQPLRAGCARIKLTSGSTPARQTEAKVPVQLLLLCVHQRLHGRIRDNFNLS
jgi:hypothetical protein